MKKILSLFLTVSLLCSLLSAQAFAVDVSDEQGELVVSSSTPEEPALQAAPSWGNDYDNAENFTISTVEELLAFAGMVNGSGGSSAKDFSGKTITLTTDLDLSDVEWVPIGCYDTLTARGRAPFAGTFDGQNHTISNISLTYGTTDEEPLYDAAGLFGVVSGKVVNVNVTNLSIAGANQFIGGIAGKLLSGATISNCTAQGKVSGAEYDGDYSGNSLGGIVGGTDGSGENATITNCINRVDVTSESSDIGGIIGKSESGLTISKCTNCGAIVGGKQTGGIVGRMSKGIVKGCSNSGSVTSTGERCGGIAGDITESSIGNCENTGAVSADQSDEAGGIVGRVYAESTVESCINTGTVSGVKSVGGIAGSVVPYGFSSCTISDCTNSGSVSGTSNVGGIAGETSTKQANESDYYKPNAEISACSNSGDVSGSTNIGGIVGNHNKIAPASSPNNAGVTSAEVSGCINTGSVPEGGGAIVGTNNSESNDGTVKNPGVVENNFWPKDLNLSAVGSGAGSSDTETAETVKNNSSYKEDGTLTDTVKDEDGNEITTIADVADKILGGAENTPDALKVTVKFDKNGHGSAPYPFTQEVVIGTKVTLPSMSNDGYYTFLYWTIQGDNSNTQYSASTEYTITSDTTFVAIWRNDKPSSNGGTSDPSYSITTPSKVENGTIKVSPKSASKGTTVTITVTPDEGYEVDEVIVTDKSGKEISVKDRGDGKYTFTMPASKVDIEVTFVKIEEPPTPSIDFVDVPADAYYADAVAWAVENGITNGTSATTFSPDASCTRAQMVTFLWRAAGSPKATGGNPFTDVSADDYYYEAVLWAVEQGITNGTSAATFSPDATVTRGQTVTFLWRAGGSPAASGGSFADVAADAYYAPAVQWAVANGVTYGTSSTTFSPDDSCTRAQIVTFLWRDMA